MKRPALIALAACALAVVIYVANSQFANTPSAPSTDYSAISDLREGDMRKLMFEPGQVSEATFTDAAGTELTFADFKGKTVLVNFWATWCAPCRKEMPALEELRATLGGDNFDVIPVATGAGNAPAKIDGFYRRENITDLPYYLDPSSRLATDMGVRGLPITLIIDESGQEVARMTGEADWASENAIEVVRALLEAQN